MTGLLPPGRFRWWFALLGAGLLALAAMAMGWIYTALPPLSPALEALSLVLPSLLCAAIALGLPRGLLGPLRAQDFPVHRPKGLWLMVALAFVLITIAVRLWELLSPVAQEAAQTVTLGLNLGRSPWADGIVILVVAVAAPLGEELFFRGLIFRALRDGGLRRLSRPVAVAIAVALSSLAFGLVHTAPGQDAQFWMICLMGAVMALSYEITGSLLAAIMVHAMNNSLAALQNFWLSAPAGTISEDMLILLIPLAPLITYALARYLGRTLIP